MEKKVHSVVESRYQIENCDKRIKLLVLSPEENDKCAFINSVYRAVLGYLPEKKEKDLNLEYEVLDLSEKIKIIDTKSSIFNHRQARFKNESLISYYIHKHNAKSPIDIINFNIMPLHKPNALALVLNESADSYGISDYSFLIQDYKNKGIIYPYIVVPSTSSTPQEQVTEKLTLALRLPRTSFNFLPLYYSNQESTLEKDLNILEFMKNLINNI